MEVAAGDGAEDIRGREDWSRRKCGTRNGRKLRSRPRVRTGCDRSTRPAQRAAALASLRLTARGEPLRFRSRIALLQQAVQYALLCAQWISYPGACGCAGSRPQSAFRARRHFPFQWARCADDGDGLSWDHNSNGENARGSGIRLVMRGDGHASREGSRGGADREPLRAATESRPKTAALRAGDGGVALFRQRGDLGLLVR